jgi:diguanylate cyclase (GGDEF)-like protein
VDLRTLFIAQTCALAATAMMLWVSRSDADRRNGMRTWTVAITSQAIAYLVLSNRGILPPAGTALVGNLAGALSVALFFVAIRQFAGLGYDRRLLAVMVVAVTIAAGITGKHYVAAAIFNGFAYAGYEWLKARTLWCAARPAPGRVQRVVALFYAGMGVVLPARAAALLVLGQPYRYLDVDTSWQVPIYIFGFIYIVVTNLGFVLMCKMRAETETRLQARTDDLTGLANRRALDEEIVTALAVAQRSRRPFAVVMADVDRFKFINDTFGHAVGDATLTAFSLRLATALRSQDRVFRYGGEEFCLLLPDTDAQGAVALAERAREQIAQPFEGAMRAMTASFGVAVWQPGDGEDSMLGRADQALYRAKARGRNRVELA